MRISLTLAAMWLSLWAAGCGGGANALYYTEQVAGMCPPSATILTGTKKEGELCAHSVECSATCCTCTKGTGSYLAAACDGKCLTGKSVCDHTEGPTVCN